MVQEVYRTHAKIREACDASISGSATMVEADITEAMKLYGVRAKWSAQSLALHTQAVLQGAFILAKAKGGPEVAAASIDHLRRYIELLFKASTGRKRRLRGTTDCVGNFEPDPAKTREDREITPPSVGRDIDTIIPQGGQCKGEMSHEKDRNVAPDTARGGRLRAGCSGDHSADCPCARTRAELSPENEEIVRKYYKAWEGKDWHPLDILLADDFTFTSPVDDHISKSAFKKGCWDTQIALIERHDLKQVIAAGNEAFVMYVCHTTSGKAFRNVEYLRLKGERWLPSSVTSVRKTIFHLR